MDPLNENNNKQASFIVMEFFDHWPISVQREYTNKKEIEIKIAHQPKTTKRYGLKKTGPDPTAKSEAFMTRNSQHWHAHNSQVTASLKVEKKENKKIIIKKTDKRGTLTNLTGKREYTSYQFPLPLSLSFSPSWYVPSIFSVLLINMSGSPNNSYFIFMYHVHLNNFYFVYKVILKSNLQIDNSMDNKTHSKIWIWIVAFFSNKIWLRRGKNNQLELQKLDRVHHFSIAFRSIFIICICRRPKNLLGNLTSETDSCLWSLTMRPRSHRWY